MPRLRDSRDSDPIALTAAVLVALASAELELEPEEWEVVADGVLRVEHEPLFAGLFQALPDKARQAIRDAMPED